MARGLSGFRPGALALAGLLGVGGLLIGGAGARGADAPPPPAAASAADSAGFSIAILDSAAVEARLTSARGRWLLVNVWATWCRPCVQETPELVALVRALPAARFAALGLSTDLMLVTLPEARTKVETYRGQFAVPYPLALYSGSNDALTVRFRLSGAIPATLLYDPEGREAGRWERRLTKADLARIRALVAP